MMRANVQHPGGSDVRVLPEALASHQQPTQTKGNTVTTATATQTKPVIAGQVLDSVIDKMRDVQSEGDRWNLAESLKVAIPKGADGFGDIIDAATAEGVVGNLSANTLRLYRDTANRWPADKRVPNVSFSAHREAMVLPDINAAVKMLSDLSKTLGASKVTVSSVRKAVAVTQGKQPTGRGAAGKPGAAAKARALDVILDLQNGGTQLIAAIGSEQDGDKLDKLNAGLGKVIAHVERQRAKVARAKAKAKPATNGKAATPAKPAEAKPAASAKPKGDVRGL